MEYPSLLWQAGLDKNKSLFPKNSANRIEPVPGGVSADALADLLPDKVFGPLTGAYFRYPCEAEEITARQQLLWTLAHNDAFAKAAEKAADACNAFESLYHRWQAPELPKNQKLLLFPAVAASWLTLCEALAALATVPVENCGYAHKVGAHFQNILAREDILAFRELLAHYEASRGEGVRLTIQSGTATAYPADSRHVNVLRQYFEDMGLSDVWPTSRVHRADNAVIDAYTAVYPDVLDKAARLTANYGDLLTEKLTMADVLWYAQELAFAREAAGYIRHLEDMGYPLCLPKIAGHRTLQIRDLRDVSLARRDMRGSDVVPNDVHMSEENKTHFHYVTGANGGGKTTYLRALGIAVLFFLTGCPIAAADATLWPFTRLCTHFPSPENFEDSGRFVDEMRRADEIRAVAAPDTVALFNETFSGTDEGKSEACSRALAEDMYHAGAFGLYVTHLHSLTHGEIPTLSAMIDETDENRRTYRIRPRGSTDSSFAADILKKYDLTEEGLARRLALLPSKGGRA